MQVHQVFHIFHIVSSASYGPEPINKPTDLITNDQSQTGDKKIVQIFALALLRQTMESKKDL